MEFSFSNIVLLLLLFIHLGTSSYYQTQIIKGDALSKSQKVLNSILVWIIPVLWFQLIKDLLMHKTVVITKKKREQIRKKSDQAHFYDSKQGWGS